MGFFFPIGLSVISFEGKFSVMYLLYFGLPYNKKWKKSFNKIDLYYLF